jgi:hypothetical protein
MIQNDNLLWNPLQLNMIYALRFDLVSILEKSDRVMRHRTLKCVKVLWSREATWDLESRIRKKYPELFMVGM